MPLIERLHTTTATTARARGRLRRIGRRAKHRAAGFTLIAVIWTLGLLLLLTTSVMVGARYRLRSEASLVTLDHAAAAADSAVNLAILIALDRKTEMATVFPLACTMPGGERALISVSQESGKVDLNAGSSRTLASLFTALTGDRSRSEQVTAAIAVARDPRLADAQSGPIGFRSILELDRISGMTPNLLRASLPMLTVRSGRVEPNPATASPTLRDILDLDGKPQDQTTRDSELTIRADVSVGGGRFIREALVSLQPGDNHAFAIREWRRADDINARRSSATMATSASCLSAVRPAS